MKVGLGAVLVTVAFFLPIFTGGSFPFTEALVDSVPPTLSGANPGGSESSPSLVKADSNIDVSVLVYDATTGVAYVEAVASYGTSQVKIQNFLPEATPLEGLYRYYTTWRTPNQNGLKIAISYKAVDGIGLSNTVTGYAYTGSHEGSFKINNGVVTASTKLSLTDRKLSFAYESSLLPDQVYDVRVRIYELNKDGSYVDGSTPVATVQLVKSPDPSKWGPVAYTIPKDGRYNIIGDIKDNQNLYLQRMNIIAGTPDAAGILGVVTLMRILLGGFGVVLMGWGAVAGVRRR